MKLKLKLNHSELLAIVSLLSETCTTFQAQMEDGNMEMEDKLYKAIFDEMYVKMLKKTIEVQKSYSLDIQPSWGIAFHIQFSGLVNRSTYLGNLTQQICDRVHKQFS
jgi:hypothetical protein